MTVNYSQIFTQTYSQKHVENSQIFLQFNWFLHKQIHKKSLVFLWIFEYTRISRIRENLFTKIWWFYTKIFTKIMKIHKLFLQNIFFYTNIFTKTLDFFTNCSDFYTFFFHKLVNVFGGPLADPSARMAAF